MAKLVDLTLVRAFATITRAAYTANIRQRYTYGKSNKRDSRGNVSPTRTLVYSGVGYNGRAALDNSFFLFDDMKIFHRGKYQIRRFLH